MSGDHMTKRQTYDYRDGAGRTGRAYAGGIVKLLAQGRRLVVQRTRPVDRGARAARVAASQLAVREHGGPNTGEQVRAYQAATSVPGTGWPWCVAFTRWVWDRAGIQLTGYRGAYAPHLEAFARATRKWSAVPVVGAIVVFDWQADTIADHVGVVVGLDGRGSPIVAVEGNAQAGDDGDQSNGGGVYRRSNRPASQIRGYVHP